MFEKILYPTDFSDASKKALDYVKQLKEAGTKEVVILHVIDLREIGSILRQSPGAFDLHAVEQKLEQEAKKEMKPIEAELKKSGFDVKARIETGIPFADILRVEEEEGVSVIVIGSHGKSCIEQMLLGSVSEKVVRKSNKPVLVIRR